MNLPTNAGDAGDSGLTPRSGRSPVWGNVNPLQYSYLENPIDRAVWWATVHRVAKRTRMSDWACSSRVSHQTWRLIFQFCIFCLFILSMGFSMQEYWSRFPFPPSVDQVLSELFTMTCLSWVALHSMAHSFTELCKSLPQDRLWSMKEQAFTSGEEIRHGPTQTSQQKPGIEMWLSWKDLLWTFFPNGVNSHSIYRRPSCECHISRNTTSLAWSGQRQDEAKKRLSKF